MHLRLVTVLALVALAGCTNGRVTGPKKPIVLGQPQITPHRTDNGRNAVNVAVTVDKAGILGQEFYYGADLQYSSLAYSTWNLYLQSIALGHIPARFRIAGDELQLVADSKEAYPSDVNHPELLITRFKILAQTDTHLTISAMNSSSMLGKVMAGMDSDTAGRIYAVSGKPPRELWARSFEYAPKGDYLLQETSIETQDGVVGEFMESIFPRANLKTGAQFESFRMAFDHPTGGDEGAVGRYGMLKAQRIFDASQQAHTFATHYDLSDGATIDWYVTRNIPDDRIAAVRDGVIGWNRYFRQLKGVERDVMRFMGKLPENVKLGDPRYNVVNWDSRMIAGAAYESAAADPFTGKQSHSLVYLPAAWFKIGVDYWKSGQTSEPKAAAGKSLGLACLRDLSDLAAVAHSGKFSSQSELDEFATELLKAVVLHEVGHALGLDHNFKGSLVFDRSKPGAMFSTSIMDYNHYDIERGAFTAVDSAEGPLLEYDRQIISVLYNGAKDVKATDLVLPACNDPEADAKDGGIDPLCVRYDIETDPSLSVARAVKRLQDATIEGDITAAQAIQKAKSLVLTGERLDLVKTAEDLAALRGELAAAMLGSVNYYLTGSKASLGYTLRTNTRLLYTFADGALPDGMDAAAMRERVFAGVQAAAGMTVPSPAIGASGTQAINEAKAAIAVTPYIRGLGASEAEKAQSEFGSKLLSETHDALVTKDGTGLAKLRAAALGYLARQAAVPFYFGKAGQSQADYEAAVVGILADALSASRLPTERKAAATSLASFKGRVKAESAIDKAITAIKAERESAIDNGSRELAEELLKILTG